MLIKKITHNSLGAFFMQKRTKQIMGKNEEMKYILSSTYAYIIFKYSYLGEEIQATFDKNLPIAFGQVMVKNHPFCFDNLAMLINCEINKIFSWLVNSN